MASKDCSEKETCDDKFYLQSGCSHDWQTNIIAMDTNLNGHTIMSPIDLKRSKQFNSSGGDKYINSSSINDFQELHLPPLLGLPLPLGLSNNKLNLTIDSHLNQSNVLLSIADSKLITSSPIKISNDSRNASSSSSINCSDFHSSPSSVPNIGVNIETPSEPLPIEYIANVEEWFKPRSDSLSSLELDADMKHPDYDFNEFLNLKFLSQSTTISSSETPSKSISGVESSLSCHTRPVTPGNPGFINMHTGFSDNESSSSICTNSSKGKGSNSLKKNEFSNISLGLEKGTLDEILASTSNDILKKFTKIKELNNCMEDKGMFEELLLPNVQDWLLSVSSPDKKFSINATDNDPFSVTVPQSAGGDVITSISNISSINKSSLSEYNEITVKSSVISNLVKTMQFDESPLKAIDDDVAAGKSHDKLPVESILENKLFNLLDLEEAPDSDKQELPDSHFDKSMSPSKIEFSLPIMKEKDGELILESTSFISPNSLQNCSIESVDESKKSKVIEPNTIFFNNSDISSQPVTSIEISPSSVLQVKSFDSKLFATNANFKNISPIKLKKTSVPKLIIPQQPSLSTISKQAVPHSPDRDENIKLLPVLQPTQENKKAIQSSAGIAKIKLSVHCTSNTTHVSILSSNNECTFFNINSSDYVKAISSIKDQHLQSLGLKSRQLKETANAAQKLLSNSYLSSENQIRVPQNFEIKQQIQEIRPPVNRPRIKLKGNNNFESNAPNEITVKIRSSAETVDIEKLLEFKYTDKKKEFLFGKKVEDAKLNNSDKIGISLLHGSPPTMVAIPSVLDALSGPTSSKINLIKVLATRDPKENKCPKKGKKQKDAQDEKINSALIQLGFDPYSLKTDKDCGNANFWPCPIESCSKRLEKLSYLKVHILTHKGIRPYKCNYEKCDWSFYTSYKLKRHLETHLKRRDFVCTEPDCSRRFTTVYNLNTHVSLHKRPKPWICTEDTCKLPFRTRSQLEVHMKLHTDAVPPYQCSTEGCSKAYYTPNSLASHTRTHHKDQDLVCQWLGCGKKFDKPCRLNSHMRSHTGQRPYACTFEGCSWRFHCASKLSRHQRKHTNERKFSCPICKKAFLRSDHLKEHILTHTGVRNFQCPFDDCDAKFTAKSSLYVHLKKHKFPKDDSKVTCPYENCDILFDSKYSRRQHLLKDHPTAIDEQPAAATDHLVYLKAVKGVREKHLTGGDSMLQSVAAICSEATIGSSMTTSGDPESSLVPLLGLSSGINLVENPSEGGSMPMLVAEGLMPFGEVVDPSLPTGFGFLPLSVIKDSLPPGISFPDGSSARTSVIGNYLLSKNARKRSLSKKILVVPSEVSKLHFSSDLSFVDPPQASHFQPVLMQDDPLPTNLYSDLLSDAQSTINLRDLE